MDPQTLSRLVRQHARTAQLMGVDFVAAYRTSDSAPIGEAPTQPDPEPAKVEVHVSRVAAIVPDGTPEAPAPKRKVATQESATLPPLSSKSLAANETAMTALRARYEADAPHAAFDTTFTNIVWGDGDVAARLCFVGEAPGEDEDLQGKPFVGRSGQLLEKMIVAMGLSRAEVYICNVLKTRPPGNRTPTPDEVAASKPYLLEQLSIVRPEAIVGLGLSACGALLGPEGGGGEPMSRLRGRWWEISDARGVKIPFMPTYHPAFLLRSYSDENRAKVWSDLKMVMDRLGIVGKKPVG